MTVMRSTMKAAVDFRCGQLMFWDNGTVIGMAARDISEGEVIEFSATHNTRDILVDTRGWSVVFETKPKRVR